MIAGPFSSGVAVGNNGVATKNTDTPVAIHGRVTGVYVRYNDSPPAGTTDIAITTKGTNAPAKTILAVADAATDKWFYPRVPVQVNTTGADIADTYDWLLIDDIVNVKIDQANAGDSIDVWLELESTD